MKESDVKPFLQNILLKLYQFNSLPTIPYSNKMLIKKLLINNGNNFIYFLMC